ncbi:hypothetical protein P154DRAFT_419962 [Amniculicola lignicola CBS 123094]|uniref:Gcp-like domain-containing protein n=1 Tax=Amniculicola lignicola CBS 123094 TaxID=1392246 RepID=A0A6A5X385_9PLEO|nr:hypothetical protein P154DRAFT_419962 [Amniculicola lignicola CBS 123094]
MRIHQTVHHAVRRPRLVCSTPCRARHLLTLAIETSCDDTAVAILETCKNTDTGRASAVLHFHKKVTSNNTVYHGIHPLTALVSHQQNLASLVDEAIQHLPPAETLNAHDARVVTFPGTSAPNGPWKRRRPDFIAVTRGPGMRSNLFTGLDTAKGLAAAWQIGLVGVHHMQAHALTPRLVSALQNAQRDDRRPGEGPTKASAQHPRTHIEPEFPFLSVLASGGHTLLIRSESLAEHEVIATTKDIALGACLDKIARVVLPPEILQSAKTTMYGALLEADYCSIYGTRQSYGYVVPRNNDEAPKESKSKWGWSIHQPLAKAAGGAKRKSLEMSFTGMTSAVERILSKVERASENVSIEERRAIARDAMRAAFEHVASRVLLGLEQTSLKNPGSSRVATVVMAGGVAANKFLRFILASMLAARGYPDVRIVFPPVSLCTDNAAMIAWAGLEMYEAEHIDPRSIRAIRKWPLDELLSPQEDE